VGRVLGRVTFSSSAGLVRVPETSVESDCLEKQSFSLKKCAPLTAYSKVKSFVQTSLENPVELRRFHTKPVCSSQSPYYNPHQVVNIWNIWRNRLKFQREVGKLDS